MGTLENILISDSKINRRTFLKTAGLLGVGLAAGCQTLGGWDPNTSPPEEFSIEKFDRWFVRNELYNGVNPNLESPHRPSMHVGRSNADYSTFKANTFSRIGATPGISYSVPHGEVMVAAAPGIVCGKIELKTGRAGGMMVYVAHDFQPGGPFFTEYAHLDQVYVKKGNKVKRGGPIGKVTKHCQYAKLLFQEGISTASGNYSDPDNYGHEHSYMDYYDGNKFIIEDRKTKLEKQVSSYKKLESKIFDSELVFDYLELREHGATSSKASCVWSDFEKFKFLELLYKHKPDFFQNLSQEEFQTIKKDFYDNQPIVLTLPFKKGGMRR